MEVLDDSISISLRAGASNLVAGFQVRAGDLFANELRLRRMETNLGVCK